MVTQHYHLFIFAPVIHLSHQEMFEFGFCVLLTYTIPPRPLSLILTFWWYKMLQEYLVCSLLSHRNSRFYWRELVRNQGVGADCAYCHWGAYLQGHLG